MNSQSSPHEKLKLFKKLFKGREDVFAIHWQQGSKSGYMPAYSYDPYMFRLHKMKGGTFKDYEDKEYLPLTDEQIIKHLKGEQLIGIYPLLQYNTSWFIAVDFDKGSWSKDCSRLIQICSEKGLPAYLERSRSGKGGHVWIFFDHPFPAFKSRKILTTLMQEAGVLSSFDKNSSFDRLFPNQDYLSGKGLGNLIALPLYKQAVEKGNSCFINNDLQKYDDQWKFLSSVKQVPVETLNRLYAEVTSGSSAPENRSHQHSGKLQITLSNVIKIHKSSLNSELAGFLRENLNFANSEFFITKKAGRSTFGVQRYFNLIEDRGDYLEVPRGFIGKLLRYCMDHKVDFIFKDLRKKHKPIKLKTKLQLRPYQETAVDAASKKDFGVITAPPGTGKTIIGLKIIADKQQPALILVHRKQLMEQWIERVEGFLGLSRSEINKVGSGYKRSSIKSKNSSAKPITIAMIQSLGKFMEKEPELFTRAFGTVILDECHHIPAHTFSNTISKLAPYYQYGLTATPFRKHNDEKKIFIHLGEIIADIKPSEVEQYKRARIIIRKTSLDIAFNPKTDQFEILSKVLIHDPARNNLILKDITNELNKGRKAVIITERKEHIDILYHYLKSSFEVITLSGQDNEKERKTKWNILKQGNYQALITTGQYFGEGSDLQNASCLFLAYPFSFKGKLIQYIGRVQRSEVNPVIYDYHDYKVEFLNKLFLKRNVWYRHFDRQATLFDDVEPPEMSEAASKTIRKNIKVKIDDLNFLYGAVAFKYAIPEGKIELEFEIENDEVRPEFDVLKPYFSKVLHKKTISADIFAEFENNQLISQIAVSDDLTRINREIIEGVKFRYLQKDIIGKQPAKGSKNLLNLKEIQENEENLQLYENEEELLNELLKDQEVKHFRQLRHLAYRHEGSVLKLRFILHPFSFVFLLNGKSQHHIILETLDTEEATYLWHIDKDQSLQHNLNIIDKQLEFIRNHGRQEFLKNPPSNFSRIIHDYSDERKGFIIWKDQLEERLV